MNAAIDATTDRLPLDAIRTHPRLQPRGGTDYRFVRRYAEAIRDGAELPPIRLGRVGKALYVVDGHHRLEATALAGLSTIRVAIQRYRTLDDAHRAALQSNRDHGKQLSNKEKENALRSYIDHNLHLHGRDDLSVVPGTIKSLRTIARECPVYDFRTIGRKLKEWDIAAPRDDVKPFAAGYGNEWNGPSEEDIAEDDQIALKTLQDHLAGALEAWAILSPDVRGAGTKAFRDALLTLETPKLDGPSLLTI